MGKNEKNKAFNTGYVMRVRHTKDFGQIRIAAQGAFLGCKKQASMEFKVKIS